jgi:hypothetical protein
VPGAVAVVDMALWPPPPDQTMAAPAIGTVWLAAALITVVVLLRGRRERSRPQ